MATELDGAALHYLLSKLPGETLAACAQVCRSWRDVASSEQLWQQQCLDLEPHPHLRRDDLLPEFGGSHRRYYAWRWPMLRRPLGRILVEGNPAGDDNMEVEGQGRGGRDGWDIATFPAWPLPAGGGASGTSGGGGGGASSRGASGSQQSPSAPAAATAVDTRGGDVVQQPTWAPAGGLVAFTEVTHAQVSGFWEMASQVVVADGRTGRRLVEMTLADPYPPFYFMWLACGTRLLLLSNWELDVVALRALDLGPALLPHPPPATPSSPQRPRRCAGREVLLATGRPLFLAASPASTRLLWHSSCQEFGLCDAATTTAEDGSEEDCFFKNELPCGMQAPQWVVDPAGADWLLMPVMLPRPEPAAAAGDMATAAAIAVANTAPAGVLVLASLAKLSEAYEAEGSRLTPSLVLSLSEQVSTFGSARDLSCAASPDASVVAWCDRGQLSICWRSTGAVHKVPLRGGSPSRGGARVMIASVGGAGGPTVLAMQWSPDGRRLLCLVRTGGGAPMVALSKHPHFRWAVYDLPRTAPDPKSSEEAAAVQPGWLGHLTWCRPFNPTLEFFDRYLPFWDQFSRSMRLWSPCSSSFCFSSRGRPSVSEVCEEAHISVQAVPPPDQAAAAGAPFNGKDGSRPNPFHYSLLLGEAPLPTWLAPGSMASWSWQ